MFSQFLTLAAREVTANPERVRLSVLYSTIGLVCQTLFYGLYICIFSYCSYVMIQKGLRGQYRITLFSVMAFMFTMCSIYWIISIASVVDKINFDLKDGIPRDPSYRPMFSAFILVNYCLTDGVVFWRAWVLCKREYRTLLLVPGVLLIVTALSITSTIGVRCAITAKANHGLDTDYLDRAIDICQVLSLIFTLLTNITATGIVALKAWKQRVLLKEFINHGDASSNKVGRVLSILVDSGLLYVASTLFLLASTLIRLPDGTLGGIYQPVNVQIAGIFPTLVFLLVTQEQGMDTSAAFSMHEMDVTTARSYPASYKPESRSESQVATLANSTISGQTQRTGYSGYPRSEKSRIRDDVVDIGPLHRQGSTKSANSWTNTSPISDEGHAFPLRFYQVNQ